MAKINGGILGTMTGKVAGVVGGTWKDKNYIRAYAKPSNPNTVNQQVQRSMFANCVSFAKAILGQVINPFVDPFQRGMSGFNYFIKQNVANFDEWSGWNKVLITFGKLFMPTPTSVVCADGVITATMPTDLGINGAATDGLHLVVAETDQDNALLQVYVNSVSATRADGAVECSIGGSGFGRSFQAFVFYDQKDTKDRLTMVSDSVVSFVQGV